MDNERKLLRASSYIKQLMNCVADCNYCTYKNTENYYCSVQIGKRAFKEIFGKDI